MATEMGEYIVGAYLKYVRRCDIVDYGVRTPDGKLEGLNELDVLGLDLGQSIAYLCEVTTHIKGMTITDYATTVKKVRTKYTAARKYADRYLKSFDRKIFMLWSPRVPAGKLTSQLCQIGGFDLIINREYTKCIEELRRKAEELTHPTTNPSFRVLQILAHLRH